MPGVPPPADFAAAKLEIETISAGRTFGRIYWSTYPGGTLRWGIVAEMKADDGPPPRQLSEVNLSPHSPHEGRKIHVAERDLRLDVALRPFR